MPQQPDACRHSADREPPGSSFILFSRDPGAANLLLAVQELLNAGRPNALRNYFRITDNPDILVLAKDFAREVWENEGIPHTNWEEIGINGLPEFLRRWPGVRVLTGTSDLDDRTDTAIWRTCREHGTETAAFVDHWSNLSQRFTAADGSLAFPDSVFVTDAATVERAAKAGIPENLLHVSGNLHLARIAEKARRLPASRVVEVRDHFGANSGRTLAVFCSENVEETAALGKPTAYSEHDVLRQLIQRLAGDLMADETDASGRGKEYILVVRPHPKDTPGKYDAYRAESPFRVIVSKEFTSLEVIRAADIVFGMNSMPLREAEAIGKPVVHLVSEA